jgi:hypothetical protein
LGVGGGRVNALLPPGFAGTVYGLAFWHCAVLDSTFRKKGGKYDGLMLLNRLLSEFEFQILHGCLNAISSF